MKKLFAIILVLTMCFSICACGFDQDSYDTYLSGKRFESDGRILTFDNDNNMTYTYTNMMGNTFCYTYSITELNKDDDKINFTLKRVSTNNDIEDIDNNEAEEATYDISDNSVKYYSNLYEYVD